MNNAANSSTPASRRAILRSIALLGLGALAGFRPDSMDIARAQGDLPPLLPHWQGQRLGRVSGEYMNLRSEPRSGSDLLGTVLQDDILRVRRAVEGETVFFYNNLWLETELGYVYSSYVQPLRYHPPNPAVSDLGPHGKWAQLTVPYSESYWDPDGRDESRWANRLHYGTVWRIRELVRGEDGKAWYLVEELYQKFYVRAAHLRIIPPEELAPISPEVPADQKRIIVNIAEQTLTAYEGERVAYHHRISSGRKGFGTPPGTHYVFDKRASERMVGGLAGGEGDDTRYNLGGVPFVCYITIDWVAMHGCYWHNDFGQPRSRGCINLPDYAARWVWRWTTPYLDYDEFYRQFYGPSEGTRVDVT